MPKFEVANSKNIKKKLQNCTLLKLIKKVGSKIKVSLLGVVAFGMIAHCTSIPTDLCQQKVRK